MQESLSIFKAVYNCGIGVFWVGRNETFVNANTSTCIDNESIKIPQGF